MERQIEEKREGGRDEERKKEMDRVEKRRKRNYRMQINWPVKN